MKIQTLDDQMKKDEVGGKSFNLSLLKQQGLPVPEGFVLSTEYYFNYLKDPKTTLAQLQKELVGLKLKPQDRWMVRSSAVGEDSGQASFAGQLDSFKSSGSLEEISQHIEHCWNSMNSERVRDYQKEMKLNLNGMAVLVQKMIEPDFAGVLFTESPIDPDEMAIEYVPGHAEDLVQGKVNPESLSIGARGDQKVSGPSQRFNFAQLVVLAKKIETYFGCPQDIEWALDESSFWIVQSRPLTTTHKVSWSNTNINENYPEIVSPLLFSISKNSYFHYFKNLFINFKVIDPEDQSSDHLFSHIVGLWEGRIYYNMTNITQLLKKGPLSHFFQNSFDEFIGYRHSKTSRPPLRIWSSIQLAFSVVSTYWGLENSVKRFERRVIEFSERSKAAKTSRQNEQLLTAFFKIRFDQWTDASFADFFAMLFHGLLGKICSHLSPEEPHKWQNLLTQGIEDLVSKGPSVELFQLSQIISSDPELAQLIKNENHFILKWLDENPKTPFAVRFFQYIDIWGFRCSGELMLTNENFSSHPENLVNVLKSYVEHGPKDPEILFEEEHLKFLSAKRDFFQLISIKFSDSLVKKWTFLLFSRFVVRAARYSISCRERVRLKQAQAYFHFSLQVKKLGQSLFQSGDLESPDEVFFLEWQELQQKIAARWAFRQEAFKSTIRRRKKRQEGFRLEPPPNDFQSPRGSDEIIPLQKTIINPDATQLSGLPACSGSIEASARILKSIDEVSKIQPGDILVTKQTDPGWISVFSLVSGIVIENGGMLSHGAIVAREFGIPAVVGVENATQIIKDGQKIQVNGDQGLVFI